MNSLRTATIRPAATPPEGSAGGEVRRVLRDQLATVRTHEAGTRAGEPGALHNFRVALRRSRTALSQLPGVLPAATADHLGNELKWLGGRTGVVRDLDVHLLKMPDYEADLPGALRSELIPLRRRLERRRTEEQAQLVVDLDSARYRTLIAGWAALLESETTTDPDQCPRAGVPVREVTSAEIGRVYGKILARGREVDDDSPDQEVHDLRKDCKKLRYLLEFFGDLYPPADIEPSIAALKRLQDVLGDFNDFSVQRVALSRMAEELRAEPGVPTGTQLAIGQLVGHFEAWQDAERGKFASAFADFSAPSVVRRYRHLFRAQPDAQAP